MRNNERRRYGNEYREVDDYSGNRGRRFQDQDFDAENEQYRNREYGREQNRPNDAPRGYENNDRRNHREVDSERRDIERQRFADEPGYRNARRDYERRDYHNEYEDRADDYYRDAAGAQRQYDSGRSNNREITDYGTPTYASQGGVNRRYDRHSAERSGDSRHMSPGQSHRGKGPKNYKRSDSRIQEDINDALYDSHEVDARDIEVDVSDGTAILSGTVDSREAKRCAEDCLDGVSGIRNLENRLHLKSDNEDRDENQPESENPTGSSNTKKNKSAKVRG